MICTTHTTYCNKCQKMHPSRNSLLTGTILLWEQGTAVKDKSTSYAWYALVSNYYSSVFSSSIVFHFKVMHAQSQIIRVAAQFRKIKVRQHFWRSCLWRRPSYFSLLAFFCIVNYINIEFSGYFFHLGCICTYPKDCTANVLTICSVILVWVYESILWSKYKAWSSTLWL